MVVSAAGAAVQAPTRLLDWELLCCHVPAQMGSFMSSKANAPSLCCFLKEPLKSHLSQCYSLQWKRPYGSVRGDHYTA